MHDELRLDNQLCFRLYTASRLITQAYTPLLTRLRLTYPQYLVLMVLWEQDAQRVNDIARRLCLETNTVTPLLQRMEKQRLLKRRTAKDDKRIHVVTLTEEGRALQEQALSVPQGMMQSLSDCPLGLDDYMKMKEQLDCIIESLKVKSEKYAAARTV